MDTIPAGAGHPAAPTPGATDATHATGATDATDAHELRILEDQLARMRGMLFGYSERFFERIRTYLLIVLALLVVAGSGLFPPAVIAVPFLVPFAFLETGYLFFYTVFARRHAEYLERAINRKLGRDVLVAHRLEAAYFYPPDAPKIAGISMANPLGMMSAMTLGYTAGAALLWLVGVLGSINLVGLQQAGPEPISTLVLPVQLFWTLTIAGHLMYSSLTRRDERPLITELDAAYGAPPPTKP
jgi:hypothetical protein